MIEYNKEVYEKIYISIRIILYNKFIINNMEVNVCFIEVYDI